MLWISPPILILLVHATRWGGVGWDGVGWVVGEWGRDSERGHLALSSSTKEEMIFCHSSEKSDAAAVMATLQELAQELEKELEREAEEVTIEVETGARSGGDEDAQDCGMYQCRPPPLILPICTPHICTLALLCVAPLLPPYPFQVTLLHGCG